MRILIQIKYGTKNSSVTSCDSFGGDPSRQAERQETIARSYASWALFAQPSI